MHSPAPAKRTLQRVGSAAEPVDTVSSPTWVYLLGTTIRADLAVMTVQRTWPFLKRSGVSIRPRREKSPRGLRCTSMTDAAPETRGTGIFFFRHSR